MQFALKLKVLYSVIISVKTLLEMLKETLMIVIYRGLTSKGAYNGLLAF